MNINELNNISELELNKGSFTRTIRNTECSTKVFGNCEVCNKEAVEIFHQVISKNLGFNKYVNRNITHHYSDQYGHIKCLQDVWDTTTK